MMGILLSKEMTYLRGVETKFLLSLVVLLLYVDKYNWLILVVWLVIFYCLFHKQMFLYYPSFIFIYFSILFFASSLYP